MLNLIAIFIGGGLGSLARYGVTILLRAFSMDFPLATLSVNVIGSLIIGFAIALFWNKLPVGQEHYKLAITVGFCGGLTTFSTFSWETFDMIKNGEFLLAVIYPLISVLACVLAVSLGVFLTKYV